MSRFENLLISSELLDFGSCEIFKSTDYFIYDDEEETYAYITKVHYSNYNDNRISDEICFEIVVETKEKGVFKPHIVFHTHDELKEIYEKNNN